MATENMSMSGDCADIYSVNVPETPSGCGPCDTMMDVNNLRIALPGAWAKFYVLWEIQHENPATYAELTTVLRKVGLDGHGDSGPGVQERLGLSNVLDYSHTSLYQGGYFYCDYDFLVGCVGVEPVGPVFVGRANASGPNNYLTSPPEAWDGVSAETGIPGYWDMIQEQIIRSILGNYWIEFQVDTENQQKWLGLTLDLSPAGLSTAEAGVTPANGQSVVGNMNCYRVCFRARGSLNNNNNCKRFVTLFNRTATGQSRMIIPGGIHIHGIPEEGEGPLVFAQAMRVWFSGCPATPCCDSACAVPAGLSDEDRALMTEYLNARKAASGMRR